MFGFRPAGAAGCCCACATRVGAEAAIAEAASVVLPSSIVRRSSVALFDFGWRSLPSLIVCAPLKKLRLTACLWSSAPRAAPTTSILARTCGRDFFHHVADREARGLGARRELLEAFDVSGDDGLGRDQQERPV